MEKDCEFCWEFKKNMSWVNDNLIKFGLNSRILIRRNGIITMVGVGPLKMGYILILSEQHFGTIADLPDHLLRELQLQKAQVTKVMNRIFGSYMCFEHGDVSYTLSGGNCLDHAHLHIIPGAEGMLNEISAKYKMKSLNSFHDLRLFAEKSEPYLYFQNEDQQEYTFKIPAKIPSQYLRQVWAKCLGRPKEWDWALFPNFELISKTVNLFRIELMKDLLHHFYVEENQLQERWDKVILTLNEINNSINYSETRKTLFQLGVLLHDIPNLPASIINSETKFEFCDHILSEFAYESDDVEFVKYVIICLTKSKLPLDRELSDTFF